MKKTQPQLSVDEYEEILEMNEELKHLEFELRENFREYTAYVIEVLKATRRHYFLIGLLGGVALTGILWSAINLGYV